MSSFLDAQGYEEEGEVGAEMKTAFRSGTAASGSHGEVTADRPVDTVSVWSGFPRTSSSPGGPEAR